MSGIGTRMLACLVDGKTATTEELWKVVGGEYATAYSRLNVLAKEGKVVAVSGTGRQRVWTLEGATAPVSASRASKTTAPGPVTGVLRNHGWKPSLARFEPVAVTPKVGDKLLVEYPEEWRHSALVVVSREPNAEGAALCWDLRNKMCTFVPIEPEAIAKHNVKVVLVKGEKDLIALENAS